MNQSVPPTFSRRTAPRPVHDCGILRPRVALPDLLDDHVVPPLIGAVEQVEKPFRAPRDHGLQALAPRLVDPSRAAIVVEGGIPV